MKKLSSLLIAFALIGAIVTGCEEEPPAPANGPTLANNTGAGNVVDAADVPINTEFIVSIITTAGDADITEIVVEENGSAIDAGRVTLDGTAAGGNPSPIGPNFASGFNWDIGITTSDVVDATNSYTIRVTDANGLSDELTVSITQINALTETTMVLLQNQGGPAGQGGLDLNTGTQTGTQATDTDADIRDMGIDINLPNDQNWIQKIGVINNSEIAVPDASFDYDAVASTAQLQAAFELGTAITETAEKVQVDDVLLVKSEGVYFAIKVTAVNPTPADNNDGYELSVKQ
ncbi:MAG: hypothetical protein R8P61_31560 [Bacteroidia bacterium]|nr:hypothetical protein [Bacteroidia bacterium]